MHIFCTGLCVDIFRETIVKSMPTSILSGRIEVSYSSKTDSLEPLEQA